MDSFLFFFSPSLQPIFFSLLSLYTASLLPRAAFMPVYEFFPPHSPAFFVCRLRCSYSSFPKKKPTKFSPCSFMTLSLSFALYVLCCWYSAVPWTQNFVGLEIIEPTQKNSDVVVFCRRSRQQQSTAGTHIATSIHPLLEGPFSHLLFHRCWAALMLAGTAIIWHWELFRKLLLQECLYKSYTTFSLLFQLLFSFLFFSTPTEKKTP